mgnify:CR=1 FL=1
MSENRKNTETENDKLDISKSVFQVARENQQKMQEELEKKQAEILKQQEEKEKKKQEEYDKRILEEKKELMRLKQGVIEESEMIPEEVEEEIKLSFFGKIKNFFYHNKWWLIIAVPVAFVLCYLIRDLLERPKPDMVVLVIGQYQTIGEESMIQEYFESLCDDFNNNGKTEVSIYNIPYDINNEYANYANGSDTKLTTQMQIADSVVVIAGDTFKQLVLPESILVNMEELYPNDENAEDYYYYLKDTKFSERIGVKNSDIPNDLYVTLRSPKTVLYSDKNAMQKTYDKDFPVFEKFIEDIKK